MAQLENMKIRCKNENFDFGRDCSFFCGNVFSPEELYSIVMPDYFGETQKRFYYTICPYCGNYILVEDNLIPEYVKEEINQKMTDNFCLQEENLKKKRKIYFDFVSEPRNELLIRKRITEIQK